jgi:phosphoribosylglycinamide formyltransferase 1
LNQAPHRQPVVVLISGRGSNLRALIEYSRRADAAFSVTQVFSDQAAAGGLESARQLGVSAEAIVCPKGTARSEYDARLATAIDASVRATAAGPALIVLAGFMRILSASFIERHAGRILNIHPSLLPKYAGLHTHRRALEAHDAEHGATVHFVNEELDGGARVLQARVAIEPGDTEASLGARVMVQEHRILPLVVSWFGQGRLRCEAGKAWLDGRPLEEPLQFTNSEQMCTA